jgi:hypothetical protein
MTLSLKCESEWEKEEKVGERGGLATGTALNEIQVNNSVRTAKKTQYFSIENINWLMLFKDKKKKPSRTDSVCPHLSSRKSTDGFWWNLLWAACHWRLPQSRAPYFPTAGNANIAVGLRPPSWNEMTALNCTSGRLHKSVEWQQKESRT